MLGLKNLARNVSVPVFCSELVLLGHIANVTPIVTASTTFTYKTFMLK